jgi:nucleoside-diphosphate-sugar epimerase
MITGATGFVGAHTAVAVAAAGHEVVLLVRTPDRVAATLGRLDPELVPAAVVEGDMTDPVAVGRALDGCDAAVHAAAVVALERVRADEVLTANLTGARVVIDSAVERGLDPVVHVSSASALFGPGVDRLHVDLPPAKVHNAYGRSKAEAEEHARRRQDEGAPVAITYPGGVLGPPAGVAAGELAESFVTQMRMGYLPSSGSLSMIDVRDLAALHVALLEPGRGPRRVMAGGHLTTMAELAAIHRGLTGRAFRVLPLPGGALRAYGALLDGVKRFVPIDSVFTSEAMHMLTRWVPTDDGGLGDYGIKLRDRVESVADTLLGLLDAGRVSAKQVGRLAERRETGSR